MPPIHPLDQSYSVRFEVFGEARADNLGIGIQPVEIDVIKRQASTGIDVQQGEGRRLDALDDSKPTGKTARKLRLAGSQVPAQADESPRRHFSGQFLRDCFRLGRAMRNVCNHGHSMDEDRACREATIRAAQLFCQCTTA